jgi:hypothetical protein
MDHHRHKPPMTTGRALWVDFVGFFKRLWARICKPFAPKRKHERRHHRRRHH